MGVIERQIEKKKSDAEELTQKYIETLKGCIATMNSLTAEYTKSITELMDSTNEAIRKIKQEAKRI